MVKTRLELINEQNVTDIVNSNAPHLNDVAVTTVFQIADIRQPENGTGSFSRTIDIPGTPEINIFFEDVYNVNIDLQTFNPNLNVRAVYYVDELPNFEGYLQLLQVDVNEVTKEIIYKCNILGEVTSLFTKIKGLFLTDLAGDFPAPYTHTLNATNIQNSWANLGASYVYPVLDRGQAQSFYAGASGLTINQYAGNGCLFARDYLLYIFQNAGYTWTSTFLDSTFFKRMIITPTKIPSASTTTISNNKFLANVNVSYNIDKALTNPILNTYVFNSTSTDVIQYGNEVYDTGNRYNNTTYTHTTSTGIDNYYNIGSDIIIDLKLLDGGGVDRSSTTTGLSGTFTLTLGTVGTIVVNVSSLTLGANGNNSLSISVPNKWLIGNTSRQVTLTSANFIFNNPTYTLTTARISVTSGSFYAEFATNAAVSGDTINVVDMIPENYPQDQFITDIRKLFNLYFTVDKTNPKNLLIEPRPDFYSTTALDWTYKHDPSAPVEIFPVGELDNIKYTFKYAEDTDYFNEDYRSKFGENYGTHEELITNDFIRNETEISVSLASTPLVGNNYNNGLVISTWRKQENYVIKEHKAKPRILYWAGTISASNNAKPVKFAFNGSVYNYYPYAGHLDNPFNPTFDLNFGLVDYVYYIKPNQFLTNNNLYNKYYKTYIQQISDKNSKIVKTRMKLDSYDIHTFEFRFPIFTIINGEQGYYLVNKIEYNPLTSESSMVELLKLTDYPVFTPQAVEYNNGLLFTDQSHERSANQNIVTGFDNNSLGESSMIIGGESNFISEGSENVQLFNSSEVVTEAVNNFFGIGLSSTSEVSSNSINFYDSVKIFGGADGGLAAIKPRVLEVTGDFTIDGNYSIYEIDLDSIGTDVTCSWDIVTYPIQVTFKVVSNTSGLDFIISETSSPALSPPATLDGNTFPVTTGLIENEALTIYSNGQDLKQIA